MTPVPAADRLAEALVASPRGRRGALLGRAGASPELVAALKRRADEALGSDARRALAIARIARDVGRASGDALARAGGEHALAKALHANGRFAEADLIYQRVAAAYGLLGQDAARARVELARVDALLHLGRYATAERAGKQAHAAFARAGDELGAAKVFINVAIIRLAQDRHREAVCLLERARPAVARAADPELLATLDLNQAISYSVLAEFDLSGSLYDVARDGYRALGLDELVARTDYNQAYDLFLQGRIAEARRLLSRARQAFRRAGADHGLALAAMDQAEMDLMVGHPARAAEAAAEARAHFLGSGARAEAGRSALFAAQAARLLGDEARVQVLLDEARDTYRRTRHTAGVAAVALARAASPGESPTRRLRLARAAARGFAANGLEAKEATARVLEASLDLEAGRPAAAQGVVRGALRLARRRGLHEVVLRGEEVLGKVAEQRGEKGRAMGHYLRAVDAYERIRAGIRSDEDRLAFASDRASVFEAATRSALDLGRPEQAFDLVERARSRALVDLLAADRRYADAALKSGGRLARRLSRIKRQITTIEARERARERRALEAPAALASELRHAVAEREAALEQLATTAPDTTYALGGKPVVTLDELRATLGRERALVAYFGDGQGLGALLVSDRVVAAKRGLVSRRELDRSLALLRFSLGAPRLDVARAELRQPEFVAAATGALERLHLQLLEPLQAWFGDRALVIVPHVALQTVPFHALARRGQPLLADREVSVAPSATVMVRAAARWPRAKGALVLSVPDEHAPAIAVEAATVARALGATVVAGRDATAEALRRLAPSARVIHFAAHGVYEPDEPLLSGIELGDGRLTVPEVAALRLDAALVTLSACETAAGSPRGDEVLGLVRAFLQAGARSLVASLWAVNDVSTTDLMQSFYAQLRSGVSTAAALRHAALELRRDRPHPYHWAPFQLVGSWEGL